MGLPARQGVPIGPGLGTSLLNRPLFGGFGLEEFVRQAQTLQAQQAPSRPPLLSKSPTQVVREDVERFARGFDTAGRVALGGLLTSVLQPPSPELHRAAGEASLDLNPGFVGDLKAGSDAIEDFKAGRIGSGLFNAATTLPVLGAALGTGRRIASTVIRPLDDVGEVANASFNASRVLGDDVVDVGRLAGGVDMAQTAERTRVQDLARKMSSDEGFIERLIVDDAGNVLEGQHRLEALRLLGEDVPVTVVQDLDAPFTAVEATRSMNRDNVAQLVRQAAEIVDAEGGIDQALAALSDYDLSGFENQYRTAIEAMAPSRAAGAAGDAARVADGLPMDEASRLARATEQGFDVDNRVFHGTTHDFDEFGGMIGNPENHHGAAHYFTSSPEDASLNYATLEGPDLTNRIELEAERIEFDVGDMDEAIRIAKERLTGESHGQIVPAFLRLENPVDVRENGTFFDLTQQFDDEVEDFLEPEGSLVELLESVNEVGSDVGGFDPSELVAQAYTEALDFDGMSAIDFEKIVRENVDLIDAWDEATGEPLGGPGEFLKRVYEHAGFDGTIIDAESQFGRRVVAGGLGQKIPVVGMGDSVEGALHYAVFDPSKIRSQFARFDPRRITSPDVLASVVGAGLGGAALRSQSEDRSPFDIGINR